MKGNFLHIEMADDSRLEHFDQIIQAKDFRIERIVSKGHASPPDLWYEQSQDEWVIVLQGNAGLVVEGLDEIHLAKGDYIFLPAMQRHRVSYTSSEPECIWLAVHGNPIDTIDIQTDKPF